MGISTTNITSAAITTFITSSDLPYDDDLGNWQINDRVLAIDTRKVYNVASKAPMKFSELLTGFGALADNFSAYANQAEADLEWLPTSSQLHVNTTTNVIQYTNVNGVDNICYHDFDELISDSAFVMRFKYFHSVTVNPATASYYFIGLSSNSGLSATAQDAIGFTVVVAITSNSSIGVYDNSALTSGGTALSALSTGTTYYVEIIRLTATSVKITLYSDSSYTSVIATATNAAVPSTINNLRYVKITQNTISGMPTAFTSNVSEIKIWEGVTSV